MIFILIGSHHVFRCRRRHRQLRAVYDASFSWLLFLFCLPLTFYSICSNLKEFLPRIELDFDIVSTFMRLENKKKLLPKEMHVSPLFERRLFSYILFVVCLLFSFSHLLRMVVVVVLVFFCVVLYSFSMRTAKYVK